MEFGIEKMWHADNEKRKCETTEKIQLSNAESIRMLGEISLEILEMVTIKKM